MNEQEFLSKCKLLVGNYAEQHTEAKDDFDFGSEMIYVVWYAKTLQNSKALLSTEIADGMYYEVTYNGDKNEFYFDAYKKSENILIPGGELND
ncbi:DUF6275 family protein [Lacticaseibacillus brantae]|uniref:Phage protein n=1 Tax=Lacticaseibacillus brantae DSM 23927 TaxID=1423727 RepID=A0A0R2B118_9LACO|nr:DUF6275 family protein [Lacticaseibacillus brantae]KRM73024.1 hypothetical protein FC34_GL000745 [Lacticaseibacillus brantae DSM 23927]